MKKWLEDELNERYELLCNRVILSGSLFNYYKAIAQVTYILDEFEEEDVVLGIKECLLEDAEERGEDTLKGVCGLNKEEFKIEI